MACLAQVYHHEYDNWCRRGRNHSSWRCAATPCQWGTAVSCKSWIACQSLHSLSTYSGLWHFKTFSSTTAQQASSSMRNATASSHKRNQQSNKTVVLLHWMRDWTGIHLKHVRLSMEWCVCLNRLEVLAKKMMHRRGLQQPKSSMLSGAEQQHLNESDNAASGLATSAETEQILAAPTAHTEVMNI